MRYLLAFSFFAFKPRTGWKNVLCLCVILLLPVIGQMIILGYRSVVAEDLDDDPDMRYHRDFDFNRFTDYLTRGLWVGLIQLGVQLALVLGSYAVVIAVLTGTMRGGGPPPPEFMFALMGGTILFFVAASVVLSMILWPLEIYAALRHPFHLGESLAFVRTFLAAMWKESLAAILAFAVMAMMFSAACNLVILAVAGGIGLALGALVAPEVGLIVWALLSMGMGILFGFPFVAILTMANGHILSQLYTAYVDKGGDPLRTRDPFEADPMLDRGDGE